MKTKILIAFLLSYMLFLVVACSSKKEEPIATVIDTLQIKKEIQAKEDEFAATYNSGILKNIGYYADDAISYSQNKAPLVGKNAILEYLAANATSKSNKIAFTTNEIFVSDEGNQVVEIGYYKLVDSVNVVVNTGNYLCLFEKRDGNYFCIRDMSTSDMAND